MRQMRPRQAWRGELAQGTWAPYLFLGEREMKHRADPVLRALKYESIFEHSPVSLWEEDVSRLRARLDEMRSVAGFSLPAHLSAHPEFVQEAVGLIDVTDVNAASVRLFEANNKRQLLGPLNVVLNAVSPAALAEMILAIDEGGGDIEAETCAVTLNGRNLFLIAKTHTPAAGAAYPRMLVSLIDITARKEAEDRERASANILRSIIESSPDMIFVKDTSLRMVLCNAALAHNIGKEPEDTYGKSDIENGWSVDLVKGNPEKGIAGWEKDERAVLAGQTVTVKSEPSNVERDVRYFNTIRFPLRNAEGLIVGLVGIGRDVTQRLQAEAALVWERSLLTMLMDYLPDYIYFKDTANRFIRTSMAHARVLGLRDPAEAIGKTDFDFYREDYARTVYDDELRIMRTGVPIVDAEERESYPDRPDTWALTTKMPLRDARGSIIGTFGITHDITRRKQLEEKNEQLATLVEFADDAIVGLNMNRRITVWNKGAERIYGYTAEEMIAAPTSMLIPPELEGEARIIREKIVRNEPVEHFETTRLRKDGTRITVALTMSGIRDASGRIVGMASVAQDITQQKAVEARLNRARRLEGLATLAGGVAHQFNNINTVVMGYLDLLKMETRLSGPLSTYVKEASASVQKAVDITNRLLALTEPVGAAIGSVRLDVLARSVLDAHAHRIEMENVRLVLDLAETPAVEGDESRLRFVLSSVIGNALDSLIDRPVRVVRVRTTSTTDGALFEVEDSGCGIAEEDFPRIFSPFFSGKGEWAPAGSPQWKLKGVGLSLAISNTTISEYGGKIDMQSTKGTGSTFRVLLPVAQGKA